MLVRHCAGGDVVTSGGVTDVGADVNGSDDEDVLGDEVENGDDVLAAGAADEGMGDVVSDFDADEDASAYDDVESVPAGSSSFPSCVPLNSYFH